MLFKWSASGISLDQSKWPFWKGVQARRSVLHIYLFWHQMLFPCWRQPSPQNNVVTPSAFWSRQRGVCPSLIHFSSKILFCGCNWFSIRAGEQVLSENMCDQTSRLTIHVKVKHCNVGQVMCAHLSLHLILVGAEWHKHLLVKYFIGLLCWLWQNLYIHIFSCG